METQTDLSQVGLSEATHEKLSMLKEQGHFAEMQDGFKFAIGLALAHGADPPDIEGAKRTTFSTSTLDPDDAIKTAISCLFNRREGESIYRAAERLAEWGIIELSTRAEKGLIDFEALFNEAEAKSQKS
jgi:hypothetical protein